MSQLTLKNLKHGQSAYVTDISGEKAIRRRLIDMGITPGVKVTMKKTAPFGDPIEINLRGYDLSLRKSEAGRITVTKEQPEKKAGRNFSGNYTGNCI